MLNAAMYSFNSTIYRLIVRGTPLWRDKIHTPRIVYDLSANGRRLVQNASEYSATICNGEVIFEAGEATKAIPSRVLRRTQAAPSQS